MTQPPDQEMSHVSDWTGHVPEWSLELLAEDALPPGERAAALAHVERCAECAAELEGFRALVVALSGLPRFAPLPGFADAVMSRVTLRPEGSMARVRRWLPATPRGWMMLAAALLAPLLPLLAAVGWLLSHPMVTVGGLWSVGEKWISEASASLFETLLDAVLGSGVWTWGQAVLDRTAELAGSELSLVAITMALATPIAAWSLARLLRTPTGGITHAH